MDLRIVIYSYFLNILRLGVTGRTPFESFVSILVVTILSEINKTFVNTFLPSYGSSVIVHTVGTSKENPMTQNYSRCKNCF